METSNSKPFEVKIGFPQGGPMSPILFREYANDFPQCISSNSIKWKRGEDEDELDPNDGTFL